MPTMADHGCVPRPVTRGLWVTNHSTGCRPFGEDARRRHFPSAYGLRRASPHGRMVNMPGYSDLIFDVGFNNGEDTGAYLNLGYRVIAVEADRRLAEKGAITFAKEVDARRLEIINAAISVMTPCELVRFENDRWSTLMPGWVERNTRAGASILGTERVDGIDLKELIVRFGHPFYVKIDVEGSDLLALQQLNASGCRPEYVSLESSKTSWRQMSTELDVLESMGYTRFQAIPQHSLDSHQSQKYWRSVEGSSGAFGPFLNSNWRKRLAVQFLYTAPFIRYALFGDRAQTLQGPRGQLSRVLRRGLGTAGWWDTHARRSNYQAGATGCSLHGSMLASEGHG